MNDVIYASATSLARAIRTKKISSAEVVHADLQRIAGLHPLQVSASGGAR
jgi:Asp-tRNA(Asn)/Glu-tRNA(Gln) amidotransferase A subunit family amidase